MRALILIICLLFSFSAQAQTVCAGHQTVVDRLKKVFGEVPVSEGLHSNGSMVVIFSSESGTWSIVTARPDGLSCLIATGEHWEAIEPEIIEEGA